METTLLFRHLPAELSSDERKDLLHHLGAARVKVMGKTGPMKNTAFAVFGSKEQASKVLNQLHQAEFLGSKLIVEFAKRELPAVSVVDNEGVQDKTDTDGGGTDASKKEGDQTKQTEPREIKFDSTFGTWGLKHPRRPELRYLYPPPTPSILTNIMNALAAVPKFYVQVLHLMNKMDLPAPFGAVTAAPPIRPDVREPALPDDIDQWEMDISSETESELESENEDEKEKRLKEDHPKKRIPRPVKKRVAKRPRLSEFQDSGTPFEPPTSAVAVSEVFEQVTEGGSATRKIELKLPSAILTSSVPKPPLPLSQPQLYGFAVPPPLPPLPPASDSAHLHDVAISDRHQHQQPQEHHQLQSRVPDFSSVQAQSQQQHLQLQNRPQQPHLHPVHQEQLEMPPLLRVPPMDGEALASSGDGVQNIPFPSKESEDQPPPQPEDVAPSGFGIIVPVHKETDKEQAEDHTEKEWSKSKFISSSELRKSRISHSEMKELSVFKRYNEGEPSCRLYIKNLAKQVSEEDIHWIYGRYVDWENDMETNIFDIRLMKEGRMKGQAFVTLPSEKVAISALKDTNGFLLKDKPMVVQFARSAKAQEDSSTSKN